MRRWPNARRGGIAAGWDHRSPGRRSADSPQHSPASRRIRSSSRAAVSAIGLWRPAHRVGHVVGRGVPEQRRAVPAFMDPAQPVRQRLAGFDGPYLLTTPDHFLQRERARPGVRREDHRVADMRAGHAQHQVGPAEIDRGDPAAAVPGDVEAVARQCGDRLGRRGFSRREQTFAEQPRRAHGHRGTGCTPMAGEQRRGHRANGIDWRSTAPERWPGQTASYRPLRPSGQS